MFFDLRDQLLLFLSCFVCGAVLSLFYDIIRMSRMTLGVRYGFKLLSREEISLPLLKNRPKKNRAPLAERALDVVVFIGDVFFFTVAAFSLLCVFYNYGGGKVRLIALLLAAVGFFACHFTVSALFIRAFGILLLFVRVLLEYLFYFLMLPVRWVLLPLWRAVFSLLGLIGKGFLHLYLVFYTAAYKRRCLLRLCSLKLTAGRGGLNEEKTKKRNLAEY